MIVLFHCFYVLKVALPSPAFTDFVVSSPSWLRIAFSFDKAVDIFFVVSGYLIGRSLIEEHKRSGKIRFLSFYQKRFFRIVPLFWIALLFYGSFAWKGDLHSLLANFLFVENLIPSATKIVPVGWSLAVEVQFYMLAPVLVALLGTSLIRGLLGLLMLAILVRLLLLQGNPSFYEIAPLTYLTGGESSTELLDTMYYPTWARFGPIILGLIAPMIVASYAHLFRRFGGGLAVLGAVCFALGLAFPSYGAAHVDFPQLNMALLIFDRMLVGVGIVILIASWEIGSVQRGSVSARVMSNRFLVVWGRLVYPTYLFHLPFIGIALLLIFQTTDPSTIQATSSIHVLGGFVLALALMMPIMLLLHVLIERPFIRLGKQLP